MKKFFISLLIIMVVIALILIGGYLYVRYMPERSIKNQKADFSMTASGLAKEYENNQTVSDKKFIDKIIEVKGIISEINTDQNNSVVFILRDNESQTGVLCTLSKKFNNNASKYKKGDSIAVKGTCTGMLLEVVLNKCIILDE